MDFKELIFISGKGGTGKSTLSAWLSHHLVQKGRRVLLIELQNSSSVASLLSLNLQPKYQPAATPFGFDLARLTGLDCLVEYVGHYTKLEGLTQKIFESSLLRSLVNVAPGLNDLSALGKLTSPFREHGPSWDYDHVVVDAPSTGSFSSLMKAPKTLGQSVSRGPLHTQSMAIDESLRDSSKVQFFFMTLFEELPMDELEDTLAYFNDDFGPQVNVIANQFINIEKTAAAGTHWGEYLKIKIEQQQAQSERLKSLCDTALKFDLIVDSLSQVLNANTGRGLRPL